MSHFTKAGWFNSCGAVRSCSQMNKSLPSVRQPHSFMHAWLPLGQRLTFLSYANLLTFGACFKVCRVSRVSLKCCHPALLPQQFEMSSCVNRTCCTCLLCMKIEGQALLSQNLTRQWLFFIFIQGVYIASAVNLFHHMHKHMLLISLCSYSETHQRSCDMGRSVETHVSNKLCRREAMHLLYCDR